MSLNRPRLDASSASTGSVSASSANSCERVALTVSLAADEKRSTALSSAVSSGVARRRTAAAGRISFIARLMTAPAVVQRPRQGVRAR